MFWDVTSSIAKTLPSTQRSSLAYPQEADFPAPLLHIQRTQDASHLSRDIYFRVLGMSNAGACRALQSWVMLKSVEGSASPGMWGTVMWPKCRSVETLRKWVLQQRPCPWLIQTLNRTPPLFMFQTFILTFIFFLRMVFAYTEHFLNAKHL